MIPQVAHQPRNLSQQYGSPGFATPPYDHSSTPRRLDRVAPLPFRNSRPSPSTLAPPQRAYPVDSRDGYGPSFGRSHSGFGGQYNDPSEHMLRRKTPNGTLAAGYDGTPVQWSSKAPALKHVVLPVSGELPSRPVTYTPSSLDDPRCRQQSGNSGWKQQQQTGQLVRANVSNSQISGDSWNWLQTPSEAHNVWDQNPSATFLSSNGMQIPTVLQPAYQPAPGPTASNDGGFYGPYWPDGKFVPYRPAAVRDQWQQPNIGYGFTPNRSFDQPLLSLDSDRSFRYPPIHDIHMSQKLESIPTMLGNNSAHGEDLVTNSPSIYPHHIPSGSHWHNDDGNRTPTAQSVSKGNNPRFKEKTLSWAHSIYVDLLAFLHHSKKENRHLRQQHGLRGHSKNNIYPKPPRQPASYLGSPTWVDLDASEANARSNGRRASVMSLPLQMPVHDNQYNSWHVSVSSVDQRHRTSNSDVPHYIPPSQGVHHVNSSPTRKAKDALEMLTALCDQSGWSWIDGMLLGGCLAYGLGEYQVALDWYSKIIALDPKSVSLAICNAPAQLIS